MNPENPSPSALSDTATPAAFDGIVAPVEPSAASAAPAVPRTRRRRGSRVRGITTLDLWRARGVTQGMRWRFKVYDRTRHSYKTKDFADNALTEGQRWAQRTWSRFNLGMDQSGAVSFAEVAKEVVEQAVRQKRNEDYRKYMAQTYDWAEKAGLTDLRSPDILQKARRFIASLRDQRDRVINGVVLKRTKHTTRREVSAGTKNLRVKHLRALGAYALRHDLVLKNPFANLDLYDEDDKAKPVFLLPEARTMAARGENDPWYIFAMIAIYSGLRCSEITALTWGDILWNEKRIRVRDGKGSKDRNAFLQPELAKILNGVGRPAGFVLHEAVRCRHSTGHLTDFGNYLRHCGIKKEGRTIHSFRHTYTAISLASGENQFLVMSWLGHSKADITARYAKEQDLFVEATRSWPRTGEGAGEFFLARDPLKSVVLPVKQTAV